jgi:hypothetical protein
MAAAGSMAVRVEVGWAQSLIGREPAVAKA